MYTYYAPHNIPYTRHTTTHKHFPSTLLEIPQNSFKMTLANGNTRSNSHAESQASYTTLKSPHSITAKSSMSIRSRKSTVIEEAKRAAYFALTCFIAVWLWDACVVCVCVVCVCVCGVCVERRHWFFLIGCFWMIVRRVLVLNKIKWAMNCVLKNTSVLYLTLLYVQRIVHSVVF